MTKFPQSRKIYRPGKLYPEIRVPACEVRLHTDPPSAVELYDTSGPPIDRRPWPKGPGTQRHSALAGVLTPEMEFVALRESVPPPRSGAGGGGRGAGGHPGQPTPSGSGAHDHRRAVSREDERQHRHSPLSSYLDEEVEKMRWATTWGADTVRDLSTGTRLPEVREAILRHCPVPVGTVPSYEALKKVGGRPEKLSWEIYRETVLEQCE